MVNVVLKWNKSTYNLSIDPNIHTLPAIHLKIYKLTQVLPQHQKLITKNNMWSGTIKTNQDIKNAQFEISKAEKQINYHETSQRG